LEHEALEAIQRERVVRGIPALAVHPALIAAARRHAADMVQRNFFSHWSDATGSPQHRLEDEGYQWGNSGENISRGPNPPVEVVREWMASQGHRNNILNPEFMHTGLATTADGSEWVWVQVFARPL
jgi:uncharacterized protein YkwD